MKRCPQCLFIYPESDQHCDFDNTPLVVVNDSEIDAATTKPRDSQPTRRGKRKVLLIAAAFVIGLALVVVYKFSQKTSADVPVVTASEVPASPTPSPSPSPSVAPSPSPSPSPSPKASPTRTATAHTSASLNPISTSGPDAAAKRKPVIYLKDGGKIEADEVWRTRDGIWFRRNGIVTLLKHARVKSIAN